MTKKIVRKILDRYLILICTEKCSRILILSDIIPGIEVASGNRRCSVIDAVIMTNLNNNEHNYDKLLYVPSRPHAD